MSEEPNLAEQDEPEGEPLVLIWLRSEVHDEGHPPRIEKVLDEYLDIDRTIRWATTLAQCLKYVHLGQIRRKNHWLEASLEDFSSAHLHDPDGLIRARLTPVRSLMGVADSEIRVLGSNYRNPLDNSFEITTPPETAQMLAIMVAAARQERFTAEEFARRTTELAERLAEQMPDAKPETVKEIAGVVKAALVTAQRAVQPSRRKWDLKGIGAILAPLAQALQTLFG